MNELNTNALHLAQLALLGEATEQLEEVGVFVWDENRNYVAVNQAGCRLVGRTRDELLGMKVGDSTPERASPYFEDVQQRGIHTGTMSFELPSGEMVEIEWLTTRTRIASLPYMVSICWRRA